MNSLRNPKSIIAAIIFLVVVSYFFVSIYQHVQERAEARTTEAAFILHGKLAEAERRVQEMDLALGEARGAADSLATEAAQWKAKALAWKSRPPEPVPVSDPDLASGLVQSGLSAGLIVQTVSPFSNLTRQDASKVWDWKEKALSLDDCRTSVVVQKEAIIKLDAALEARSSQAKLAAGEIVELKHKVNLAVDLANAESKKAETTKNQLAAEKPKKFYWAAIAAILVALL